MEREKKQDTLENAYEQLIALEPKLVSYFVPSNAEEQRQAFLEGDVRNPDHGYPLLDTINFDERAHTIVELSDSIVANEALNPKFSDVYKAFAENYVERTRLMQLAYRFKSTANENEREVLRRDYEALNAEIYGAPEKATYESLLHEKLSDIQNKQLIGQVAIIRDELFELVPLNDDIESKPRFRPSVETVEWMHEVVSELYGGMLSHVPEQESFSEQETRAVFEKIIQEEFDKAAVGWKVDIEAAKSINVKSTEKRIVIPEDRGELSRAQLQALVVHELGVHMLRAIMGEETNLQPLRNGLNDYYDAEEGLGKVMEQALDKKFVEAGVDHYITAGLAHFDGKDFRDTFEVKWRLGFLSSVTEDEDVNSAIAKAKKAAYSGVMRSMRGTDELPWFKDLSYYNGSVDMWRYLEEIRGDDTKFLFVLLGKQNPANKNHERIVYETASR